MIIAVVHGYLLSGTGSNLYVSNLCRAFCRQGHKVLLFSQDSAPEEYDYISHSEIFTAGNRSAALQFTRDTPYPGKCYHYRPHIGSILPVYVFDRYPGFKVKEYPDLSREELETYLENNQKALKAVFAETEPHLIISQHTIMQPVYSARAIAKGEKGKTRHLITVHGSALNFSVRKSDLLRLYAEEGIKEADGFVFISKHSLEEFRAFFTNYPNLEDKCRVIPAGVDTGLFRPLSDNQTKEENINTLKSQLKQAVEKKKTGLDSIAKRNFFGKVQNAKGAAEIREAITEKRAKTDIWAPDLDTVDNLGKIDWHNDRIVLYYGKYLWTKGIHHLIAAAPLVLQKEPRAFFVLVGFGAAREYLETMVYLLDSGKSDLYTRLLQNPKEFDPAAAGEPSYSEALLDRLADSRFASDYFNAARGVLAQRIIFTGIMNHDQLRKLIPCADLTVAPSIFPEAFGLVAIESLAGGVLPVQTYHSGFAGVIDDYEQEFRDIFLAAGQKHLFLDKNLVPELAKKISSLLAYLSGLDAKTKQQLAQKAYHFVEENYSWDSVAREYLQNP